MNVIDRLFIYINEKNLRKTAFEKKAGLPNGYISKIKGSPGWEKLEDILRAFPDLNKDWLLTGEGEMLNEQKNFYDNSTNLEGGSVIGDNASVNIKNSSNNANSDAVVLLENQLSAANRENELLREQIVMLKDQIELYKTIKK